MTVLCHHLRQLGMLTVLDNCEHLVEATANRSMRCCVRRPNSGTNRQALHCVRNEDLAIGR